MTSAVLFSGFEKGLWHLSHESASPLGRLPRALGKSTYLVQVMARIKGYHTPGVGFPFTAVVAVL